MTKRRRATSIVILAFVSAGLSLRADDDRVHTPPAGSAERDGILAALHAEYTTGSGSAVKFQVKYFKVHDGWAWINVVPLNPKGEVEGEDWPSLLQEKNGKWAIIDMVKIASDLDDPVGPLDPSARFLREVQKQYPGIPADIFPKKSEDSAQ